MLLTIGQDHSGSIVVESPMSVLYMQSNDEVINAMRMMDYILRKANKSDTKTWIAKKKRGVYMYPLTLRLFLRIKSRTLDIIV